MITKSDPVLRKSVPFFSVNAVRHEQIRLSKKTGERISPKTKSGTRKCVLKKFRRNLLCVFNTTLVLSTHTDS